MNNFSAFSPKLIYVFAIHDEAHSGCLKIGETTCSETDFSKLSPNSESLNEAARKRIDQYTQTAGIAYELLHTQPAFYMSDKGMGAFNDKEVHDILLRSGIKRKVFDKRHKTNEWFITDLATVKAAIKAAKEGRTSLLPDEVRHEPPQAIEFRPEQREAIDKAKRWFKKHDQMLWNAKMRFGKTVSALELVKEMELTRTIILTHRPVVNDGWYEDFGKIFTATDGSAIHGWVYGSKSGKGEKNIEKLNECADAGECKYIWFASMQDLRGSKSVGGNFDKNNAVFKTHWDMVIVDEAHEGTQTDLGKAVISELHKGGSKRLELSGTPFNLLGQYDEEGVYTWDYIMEQAAKANWDDVHQGDPNPYECLPRMNIWTYDLGKLIKDFPDEDKAFNFREFFRTGEDGTFVHEGDVKSLLDLMSFEDEQNLYPFATASYRDTFRHTLWVLPGVREARALSSMLKVHPVFQYFQVVNVAGKGDDKGDDDEESDEALAMVREAIGKESDKSRTITLTCGRLTTGVSVPEWTAVLMLSGSVSTAAASYMQTIFRVQTPATINGRMKSDCYVFDFAPDRTLKVLAQVADSSSRSGTSTQQQMGDFLNFCPVIAIKGSTMERYSATALLEQLKRVYVERVVQNGFEDTKLYKGDDLLKLDDMQLELFDDLKRIIGTTKAMAKTGDIDINDQGLTNEEHEKLKQIQQKEKRERTQEELALLEELKAKRKNRDAAISILRGISIRMPLMIYGAQTSDEEGQLTIDNFASLIDDASWEEFMPRGVTKAMFDKFKRYYDPVIFAAAAKRIRSLARAADEMGVEERIERISSIFATFRNPDKETVLTPWRVVNMHLADTLGGWVFYDEGYQKPQALPRHVDHEGVTRTVFSPTSRILEINSKTGLYPLYAAYSIWRERLATSPRGALTATEQLALWDQTVEQNIFVVCKTPMAESITRRTLSGFRAARVNARCFEDLVDTIKREPQSFIAQVRQGETYWGANKEDEMTFSAIVGNPPYQLEGAGSRKEPIYHLFYDIAFQLSDLVTLITPARFLFRAGETPSAWMDKMLSDPHIKVVRFFQKSSDCFPSVDIKGGVAYCLRDASREIGPIGFFSGYPELLTIMEKLTGRDDFEAGAFSKLVSSRAEYKFSEQLFKEHPEVIEAQGKGTGSQITTNAFERFPDIFLEGQPPAKDQYIQMLGRHSGSRVYKWIKRCYVMPTQTLDKYKVFVPKASGTGAIGEPLSTPIIGQPTIGQTDTFLSIGPFDTEAEAAGCLKYIKTKFARTMLGTLKTTQDITKDKWDNVPLQDFSASSDIDWSRSVDEVDQQLYAKYGLTGEEVAFIERMIKPMA